MLSKRSDRGCRPPAATVLRLKRLTATALEKGGEDRDKIVLAVGKVLTECCDETYSLVGENSALLENFNRLGIGYGYEDDNGIV